MSIDDNKSLLILLGQDENKDTIPNRIQFIKTLLNNNSLKPIIDFDNTDTENFINKSRDDEDSGESYDTRAALKKEVHNITSVINNMGGMLQYIKSGTTGHTFKGEEKDKDGNILYEYAVKVVAYSIKDKYGSMYDTRRPENAELMMIKLLSYFIIKKRTPHIVLPIGTFDTSITHFTNLIEQGYVEKHNEKYQEFINRYNNGEYYDEVSILISEWANRGDLGDFIRNHYRNFQPIHWKVLFFQLISTLAVIQSKFPSFRHNDLKANNILINKINKNDKSHMYVVAGNIYDVPNIGYQLKIWDFDFACIPGIVDNKKVMISTKWSRGLNAAPTQNRYYDIHFFFNTLIKKGFFPGLMTDTKVPSEVQKFILSIVPPQYQTGDSVSKGGRILHNIEYVTPIDILRTNPYFNEFRTENKNQQLCRVTKTRTSGPKLDNFLKSEMLVSRNRNNDVSINTFHNNTLINHIGGMSNIINNNNKKNNTKDDNKNKNKSKNKSKSKKKIIKENKSKSKSKSKKRTKYSKDNKNNDIDKIKIKKNNTKKNNSKSKSKKKKTKNDNKINIKNSKHKKIMSDIDIEQILMGIN